jgi:hypothetical protein
MDTKNYYFSIEVKFSANMEASSKEEAIRFLKDFYAREHHLDLTDDEIVYEGEDE